MPQKFQNRTLFCLATFFGIAFVFGCAPDPETVEQEGDGAANLMVIETAYRQFVAKKRKPPTSKEDLEPYGTSDDSFLSLRDGKPLKIYWGTSMEETDMSHPTIIAHEVDGKGGKRLVLSTVGVMMLTEQEFAAAKFPTSQ